MLFIIYSLYLLMLKETSTYNEGYWWSIKDFVDDVKFLSIKHNET